LVSIIRLEREIESIFAPSAILRALSGKIFTEHYWKMAAEIAGTLWSVEDIARQPIWQGRNFRHNPGVLLPCGRTLGRLTSSLRAKTMTEGQL
jgi:hypothetical protein